MLGHCPSSDLLGAFGTDVAHHLAVSIIVGFEVLRSCKDGGASAFQWAEFLKSRVVRLVMIRKRIEITGRLFTIRLLTADLELSDYSGDHLAYFFLAWCALFSRTFQDMNLVVLCADSL